MLTPDQRDTLIRTVAGEAATEGEKGWAAVTHVIRNRSGDGRWPSDPAKVAKQPKQFSAWNKGAGGNSIPRTLSAEDAIYLQIGNVVDGVFGGVIPDPTQGAVFYYAPAGMNNAAFGTAGIKTPKWLGSAAREGPPRAIGNHVFVGKARQFATTPAAGAQAARGLQNYLPASQVPQPRLRPQPKPIETKSFDPVGKQRSGPLLSEQRSRVPGTPPVPPLPIPQYSPAYSVPQTGAGATGADAVIQGALTGDPAVFAQAANAVLQNGQNAPQAIGAYFQQFAQEQPALARQVAANIAGNPAFIGSLPIWARGAVQEAMTGAAANPMPLPGSQVPVPTVRPGPRAPSGSKPAPIPSFGPTTPQFASATQQYRPNVPQARPAQPKSVQTRIASAAAPAMDWLGGLFKPQSASPDTTQISAYRPMAAPRPSSPSSAPTISQASFNQRFGSEPSLSLSPTKRPTGDSFSGLASPSRPVAPVVQPTQKQSTVKMVANPAFAEWSNKVASNPALWNSTPPPKTIAQTVMAPKAVAPRPALQIIAQPRQVPAITVHPAAVRAPAPSGGARAPSGGGSGGGVPSNWASPSASYSSKSPSGQAYTVSGNTVSWTSSNGTVFSAPRDV